MHFSIRSERVATTLNAPKNQQSRFDYHVIQMVVPPKTPWITSPGSVPLINICGALRNSVILFHSVTLGQSFGGRSGIVYKELSAAGNSGSLHLAFFFMH